MRKVNKSWMALVAAGVLLGALVGVVWARPNDRPGAADITRKVTLTAADFIPTAADWDYSKSADWVVCNSGSCHFSATILFPCLPSVTVERIKLHVDDYNGAQISSAALYRANPSVGAASYFGGVNSPFGSSGGLKTFSSDTINKVVWPSQKASIWISIGGVNMKVYGVTVEYHRNI